VLFVQSSIQARLLVILLHRCSTRECKLDFQHMHMTAVFAGDDHMIIQCMHTVSGAQLRIGTFRLLCCAWPPLLYQGPLLLYLIRDVLDNCAPLYPLPCFIAAADRHGSWTLVLQILD
jgi:hypothetical protein